MLDESQGKPVHIPADPGMFRFDDEVSKIFPDMSRRAIPNFLEAHDLHARMVKRIFAEQTAAVRVLDIGASRGAFFDALLTAQVPVSYTAVDNSPAMCSYLRQDVVGTVMEEDITTIHFRSWVDQNKRQFDVVCCNYVLQFLPKHLQFYVLGALCSLVADSGLFILGHKTQHCNGSLGDAANESYIDWRVQNGYSREEIAAKTTALRGSMFPMDEEDVLSFLRSWFMYVQPTTRFLMFSTLMARLPYAAGTR